MAPKVRVQFYIDPAARDALRQIARETRRNMSAAVEVIILEEHARMNRERPARQPETTL